MESEFIDADLSDRHVFTHWSSEGIRWSDTDKLGHVNHLSIGAYMESGRSSYMLQFDANREKPLTFVTARLSVDYLQELHWPGTVQVGTTLLNLGTSSCTLGHAVFSHSRCIATGTTVLVLIDGTSRTPKRIPEDVRNLLLAPSTRTTA